jgi:uncharacterized protein HemX
MTAVDHGPTRRMLVADSALQELRKYVEQILERHRCGPPCKHWEAVARGEKHASTALLELLHTAERANRPLEWRVAELEVLVRKLGWQVLEAGGDVPEGAVELMRSKDRRR